MAILLISVQKTNKISSAYCEFHYVWQSVVCFHEFMKKVGLNPNFMLSLGMDCPNKNLLFQDSDEFPIIDIVTYAQHIVNSMFGKAIKSLKESVIDLDGMTNDFYFFFKYSAAWREQYPACHEITDGGKALQDYGLVYR